MHCPRKINFSMFLFFNHSYIFLFFSEIQCVEYIIFWLDIADIDKYRLEAQFHKKPSDCFAKNKNSANMFFFCLTFFSPIFITILLGSYLVIFFKQCDSFLKFGLCKEIQQIFFGLVFEKRALPHGTPCSFFFKSESLYTFLIIVLVKISLSTLLVSVILVFDF